MSYNTLKISSLIECLGSKWVSENYSLPQCEFLGSEFKHNNFPLCLYPGWTLSQSLCREQTYYPKLWHFCGSNVWNQNAVGSPKTYRTAAFQPLDTPWIGIPLPQRICWLKGREIGFCNSLSTFCYLSAQRNALCQFVHRWLTAEIWLLGCRSQTAHDDSHHHTDNYEDSRAIDGYLHEIWICWIWSVCDWSYSASAKRGTGRTTN